MLAFSLDGASSLFNELNGLRRSYPVLDSVLARLDPILLPGRSLARVVEVREETHDVKTFVLRPGPRFGAYRPGAYVTVHVGIGGRRVQRAYSLASPRGDTGLVTITVKRVPGGLVSNYLADTIAKGDLLELGAPEGQFSLRTDASKSILMISAGSGITPLMSMLRHLVQTRSTTPITFLHFARSPEDVIFARELAAIAERSAHVKLVVCVENADESWKGPRGRFSQSLLETALPEFAAADTYLCGPPGFMRAVMQTLEHAGADLSKLRYERFTPDFDAAAVLETAQVVRFLRSGVEALSSRPLTLLQQAEARGVRVDTGCRAGTCGTCRCRKRKGVVLNIGHWRALGRRGRADLPLCLGRPRHGGSRSLTRRREGD